MREEELIGVLRKATQMAIGSEPRVAIAYSGGVDSSIVASLAREFADVKCYTCAVSGSYDALNAEGRATAEGLDLEVIEINADELQREIVVAAKILGGPNPISLSYTIPLISVVERSIEKIVLAGNGADELFAGYARYLSLPNPEDAMSADADKMLHESAQLKTWAINQGKILGLPFTDSEVLSFSKSIPVSDKISHSGRKLILREAARGLGLPSHDRPKKAAQYSSGVLKLMEMSAKKSGLSISEWVLDLLERSGRST